MSPVEQRRSGLDVRPDNTPAYRWGGPNWEHTAQALLSRRYVVRIERSPPRVSKDQSLWRPGVFVGCIRSAGASRHRRTAGCYHLLPSSI
jgi:hypothetical protein